MQTTSDLLGLGLPSNVTHVYRWRRRVAPNDNELVLVSRDVNGVPSPLSCLASSISNDGQRVVFHTGAALDPLQDTNGVFDVYLREISGSGGTTSLVSFTQQSGVGNGASFAATISGNGQFVAFRTGATNLIADIDQNGGMHDVLRAFIGTLPPTMVRVSVDNLGAQSPTAGFVTGNGHVISDDGSRVLFLGKPCDWDDEGCGPFFNCLCAALDNNCISCQFGLVPAFQQVYLRDLSIPATFRVSRTFRGVFFLPGNADVLWASISGDGGRIAWSSTATNYGAADEGEGFEDVFFLDAAVINTTPATLPEKVSPAVPNGASTSPQLSADGSRIAFDSTATNVLPPGQDTNGLKDVFVRNVSLGTVLRFNVSSSGAQATGGHSDRPDLSGDGRVVVYSSGATNLIAGDANGVTDIFETLSPQGPFVRGDANNNGCINTDDTQFLWAFLQLGGPMPGCLDAADANDDGVINLSDISAVATAVANCTSLPAPFPTCGVDPTADGLTCGVLPPTCPGGFCQGTCQ